VVSTLRYNVQILSPQPTIQRLAAMRAVCFLNYDLPSVSWL